MRTPNQSEAQTLARCAAEVKNWSKSGKGLPVAQLISKYRAEFQQSKATYYNRFKTGWPEIEGRWMAKQTGLPLWLFVGENRAGVMIDDVVNYKEVFLYYNAQLVKRGLRPTDIEKAEGFEKVMNMCREAGRSDEQYISAVFDIIIADVFR